MDTDCDKNCERTKRRLRYTWYRRQIVVQNRVLGLVFTGDIPVKLSSGRREDGRRICMTAVGDRDLPGEVGRTSEMRGVRNGFLPRLRSHFCRFSDAIPWASRLPEPSCCSLTWQGENSHLHLLIKALSPPRGPQPHDLI